MAKHFPRSSRKGHPLQNTLPKSQKQPQPLAPVSVWKAPFYDGEIAQFFKSSDLVPGIQKLPITRRGAGAAILYALKLLLPSDFQAVFPLGVPLPENTEHWKQEGVEEFVRRITSLEEADRIRIASGHIGRLMATRTRRVSSRETWVTSVRAGALQLSLEHFLEPVRYTINIPQDDFLREAKQTLLTHLLVQLWTNQSAPLESTMSRTFDDMGALRYVWFYARATDYRLKVEGLAAMFHNDSLHYPELTAHLLASSPNPPAMDLLARFARTPSHVLQQASEDVLECQWGVLRDPIEFAWARENPWLVELIWQAKKLPSIELVQDWRSSLSVEGVM